MNKPYLWSWSTLMDLHRCFHLWPKRAIRTICRQQNRISWKVLAYNRVVCFYCCFHRYHMEETKKLRHAARWHETAVLWRSLRQIPQLCQYLQPHQRCAEQGGEGYAVIESKQKARASKSPWPLFSLTEAAWISTAAWPACPYLA